MINLENVKALLKETGNNSVSAVREDIALYEKALLLTEAILEERVLLVPVEPSHKMNAAGNKKLRNTKVIFASSVYKAMTQAVEPEDIIRSVIDGKS